MSPCVAAKAHIRQAMRRAITRRQQIEAQVAKLPNKNRPHSYAWLRGLLTQISQCAAPTVYDTATKAPGTPLFVVAGACPSVFAGMQCVLYSAMQRPPTPTLASGPSDEGRIKVDFWWVKPIDKYSYSSSQPSQKSTTLQTETLNRHAAGKFKNSPGRSKELYAPLAELMMTSQEAADAKSDPSDHRVKFGIEQVHTNGPWRATASSASHPETKRYVVLVWQEAWSSPLSRSQWIVGKLIYQRDSPTSTSLFAAPYRVSGRIMSVALHLEEAIGTSLAAVIPPDRIKLGCNVTHQSV